MMLIIHRANDSGEVRRKRWILFIAIPSERLVKPQRPR